MNTIEIIRKIKTAIASCNGFNREHRDEVFKLLDTLQEQPVCEELEDEIKNWLEHGEITDTRYDDYSDTDIEATARHFANWQKEKDKVKNTEIARRAINGYKEEMMQMEVKGYVDKDYIVTEGPSYFIRSVNLDLPNGVKVGDKGKLLFVKED